MMTIETGHLLTWLGAIASIGGFALMIMLWAYRGTGSRQILFTDPIALPPGWEGSSQGSAYQRSCDAFGQGDFSGAIAHLTTLLPVYAHTPEIFHTLGISQANLRQDNDAVRSLVRAGELYLEASNSAGFAQVKADLERLKGDRLSA